MYGFPIFIKTYKTARWTGCIVPLAAFNSIKKINSHEIEDNVQRIFKNFSKADFICEAEKPRKKKETQ